MLSRCLCFCMKSFHLNILHVCFSVSSEQGISTYSWFLISRYRYPTLFSVGCQCYLQMIGLEVCEKKRPSPNRDDIPQWPEGTKEIIENINKDRRYLDRYANQVPFRCKSVALCLEPSQSAPTYTYSFWNVRICGLMFVCVCVFICTTYTRILKTCNTRAKQLLQYGLFRKTESRKTSFDYISP